MKILVPVDNPIFEGNVCVSFARAPYFLIYDEANQEKKFIKNSAADSQGGAGIKAGQLVIDSGASVLLTPRIGENAAQVIKSAGIKIYKTIGESIEKSLQAYLNNELAELDDVHPGFHGHH